MDLKQIRMFLALFEEGSVTRAAQRLHVVQPAVSMQIRRIEEERGVTLFTRSSQGLKPTPLAAELYALCCRVAADAELVDIFLHKASGRLSGELNIGIPPSLAHAIVGDILLELLQREPGIKLRVLEGYSADLQEWLVSGQIDLAIMTAFGKDDRLQVEPLFEENLVLACGTGVALPDGDSPEGNTIEAVALAGLPLVLPTARNTLRVFVDAELARAGIIVEPRLEVDSLSIVLALLEAGNFASILPAVALARGSSQLNSRRIIRPAIGRQLVIAHKASKDLGETAEAFKQLLLKAFGREQIEP